MDNIQKEYRDKAQALADELIKHGFLATRVVKGEDRTDYHVVFFDGTHEYRISKDWNQYIHVTREDAPSYPHVSVSHRHAVYNKHRTDNMKVLNAKKLQAKIDAENAYHAELAEMEAHALNRHQSFIEAVEALERLDRGIHEEPGYVVEWSKERGGWRDGEIRGGTITKNGIVFRFELCDDGYISKKIELDYRVDNTLVDFAKLADNKYDGVHGYN